MTAVIFQNDNGYFSKYGDVKGTNYIKWFVEYPYVSWVDEFNKIPFEDHVNAIKSGKAYRC